MLKTNKTKVLQLAEQVANGEMLLRDAKAEAEKIAKDDTTNTGAAIWINCACSLKSKSSFVVYMNKAAQTRK